MRLFEKPRAQDLQAFWASKERCRGEPHSSRVQPAGRWGSCGILPASNLDIPAAPTCGYKTESGLDAHLPSLLNWGIRVQDVPDLGKANWFFPLMSQTLSPKIPLVGQPLNLCMVLREKTGGTRSCGESPSLGLISCVTPLLMMD